MRPNRRNHYRTLHVQPEAPAEIITASYRTLMQKLRHHPDLGGDPEQAVLLNQAYAVLSDPDKRQRYDEELRRRGRSPASLREVERPAGGAAGPAGASGASARPGAPFGAAARAARTARECIWCSEPLPAEIHADSRCVRCESPLSAPPGHGRGKADLFGRRQSQRIARNGVVSIHLRWGEPARGGRLRDLSLSGFSLITDVQVPAGQVLRIQDPGMDVLAVSVACQRDGRYWRIHARMTHALFTRRTGAFVATSA